MTTREILTRCQDWTSPRSVEGNPFRLACRLGEPADRREIGETWGGKTLPLEVVELWTTCREAELFIDVDYGQWGLRLLSPEASAARTEREREQREEFRETDIIIGEFLGDQDLVVLDYLGHVYVALPLDPRFDWPQVGETLTEFLGKYVSTSGDKYWERLRR